MEPIRATTAIAEALESGVFSFASFSLDKQRKRRCILEGNTIAMTKKKAKELIAQLLTEVSTETVKQQFWMDKMQGYTQAIFGSSENSIALPMFATYYNNDRPFNNLDDSKANERVNSLKELLNTYNVMVDNGVFLKGNIFSDYNNWNIIGVLSAFILPLIAGVISMAYIEGERSANYEKAILESKIERLNDRLNQTKNFSYKPSPKETKKDGDKKD